MSWTDEQIEALHDEAQSAFLGQGPVVGVGIQNAQDAPIVFLLECHDLNVELRIRKWAIQKGIKPAFQVSGPIEVVA
jgi:hypothetical protein